MVLRGLKRYASFLGVMLFGFVNNALGNGSANVVLPVSAQIANVCLNVTASDLNFGNYTGATLNAQNTITVTCPSLLSPYTIRLSVGTTPGATYSQRLMANGSYRLKYNIYTTPARTTIWGDGSAGTATVSAPNLTLIQNYPAYGRIPANQTDAAAGSYQDNITVTVEY